MPCQQTPTRVFPGPSAASVCPVFADHSPTPLNLLRPGGPSQNAPLALRNLLDRNSRPRAGFDRGRSDMPCCATTGTELIIAKNAGGKAGAGGQAHRRARRTGAARADDPAHPQCRPRRFCGKPRRYLGRGSTLRRPWRVNMWFPDAGGYRAVAQRSREGPWRMGVRAMSSWRSLSAPSVTVRKVSSGCVHVTARKRFKVLARRPCRVKFF